MKLKNKIHYNIVPLKWETYKNNISASGLFAHFEIWKDGTVKDQWILSITYGDDGDTDQKFPSLLEAKKAARQYYIQHIEDFVDQVLIR